MFKQAPFAVLIATCALTHAAAGDVLTFDDLSLPSGTIITTQYSGRGVIFAPLNGNLELRTASAPLFPTEPIGLAEIPYSTSVIIASFPSGASAAGAWIDFGEFGLGVKIEAFSGLNATGNLLSSNTTTTQTFLGVSGPGIYSVKFSNVGAGVPTYLIDNFTFNIAPAPGVVWGLGLGVLMAARRRR